MIIKYAFIKKYLGYDNIEVNLDSTYNYYISNNSSLLTLISDKDSVPDDFFADNINMNCFIGRNGSGKSLVMSLLNSLGNEVGLNSELDKNYKVVFQGENSFFYLLVVDKTSRSLKRGVLTRKNNANVVKLKEVDISLLNQYNSYYLSSNNTNMMKSWVENIDNDYSVGNERRYKGLHSLVEISQFIKNFPFENDISEITDSKKIRLIITDRWLSQLNLSFFLTNNYQRRNLTKLVKQVKQIGGDSFIILARLILLRIISSNAHKKTSLLNPNSGKNFLIQQSEINIEYLEAIIRFDIQRLISLNLFINEHYESKAHILSRMIEYHANEMGIEFSISDPEHVSLLNYLLDTSLMNEAIAEGYRYYIYPPFSTGQWKRVELVCKINHLYQDAKNNRCVNIFMDEPDADLHPEVQTNLILWLVNLMKSKGIYFNVIISSHNPLILSDFPRRKITYIGSDISTQNKDKTLGANVYNLYKNNFLVKNIISDFIKNKIENAVKNNNVDELSFLINEVSEPLLVRSLISHLNKILNIQESQNSRITSFVSSLSSTEKEFLRRRLNNEQ